MNKLKSTLLLAAIVAVTWGWNRISSGTPSGRPQDTAVSNVDDNGYETPEIVRQGVPSQLLERFSYKTSYNKETRTPNWVGWVLTYDHTDGEHARKNHSFIEDPDVPLPRAVPTDIRESECGYQRGHMCPAGDNKWSYRAQEDAFLMTNICPQNGNLNQRDWKYLEEACREWAKKYGKIYIVAGPVFYSNDYNMVGENEVAVPDAFFKVVLRVGPTSETTKAIGFIFANEKGHHKMDFYVRSVDEVEEITGMDFFHQLDDKTEDLIERESDLKEW